MKTNEANTTEQRPYDEVGAIMDYEQGELGQEETIELFQRLINSGLAWKLQGHYGRTAMQLVNSGYCTLPARSN